MKKLNLGFLKILFAIVLLFASLNAFSWGYLGHRIVAQIAMDFLSRHGGAQVYKKVSAKIFSILNPKVDGKASGTSITLPMVASYADDLRSDPRFDCIKPLHFVNIPKDVTDYSTYAAKNPSGDAVTAVLALGKFLRSNDQADLDAVPAFTELRKTVPVDQQLALKLFIHFWGDLFQPLHLGYPEDLGGNLVEAKELGENTNLHAALDGILKPYLSDPTSYAKDLERMESKAELASWSRETLLQMVNETLAIRAEFYKFTSYVTVTVKPEAGGDPNAPPVTKQVAVIDYDYLASKRPLLEQKLIESGVTFQYALRYVFAPESMKGPNPFIPRSMTCEGLFI